ncbi:MAG: cbb3-type cytochrome c oxidase subunit I, partial [Erythrobacter sp.]
METVVKRLGVWALVLLASIAAIALTPDAGFAIHMGIVALVAVILIFATASSYDPLAKAQSIFNMPPGPSRYDDDVIRWGVIATMFWGIAGLLAGVFIAAQLAFPQLNFEPWLNFGRLRPLHTSAVIFAFGGNALLATSFYVVQRTCRTTLALPGTARFVFWGYQLFIVLAATGYLLGISQ